MKLWKATTITASMMFLEGAVAFAGWRVGNPGGDPLGIIFNHAKEHAATITVKVHANALRRVTDRQTADWIINYKDKLASDILASPHRRNDDDHPTCAYTYFPEVGELDRLPVAKPIELFYFACRETVKNVEDAAALLIHESVHHFNIPSEEFADKVAVAIVSAWKSGYVEWDPIKNNQFSTAQHSAVWTGEEMIVFGGLKPGGGEWNVGYRFKKSDGSWKKLPTSGAPARHMHEAVWDYHREQMIVWGGYTSGNAANSSLTWHNSGAIWNKKTNKWTTLKNPYGPSEVGLHIQRFQPVQRALLTENSLVIWGGEVDGRALPGAIYDLTSESWSKIPEFDAASRESGHSLVYTGSKIVVWGGVLTGGNLTNGGALYDLAKGEWSTLRGGGAPKATYGHTAVWTGEVMIVFGGYDNSREMTGKGGVYDLESGTWNSFESQAALARDNHTAIWNGKEMLIFGGKMPRFGTKFGIITAYDPNTNKWRTVTSESQPSARYGHSAVWTGGQLIIFGGQTGMDDVMNDGGTFYP